MGSVYRPTYTKPLPPNAEVFNSKGETFARIKKAKGRPRTYPVTTSKDGSARIVVTSETFLAKFRDGTGRLQKVSTGCRDEDAARSILAEHERRSELVRSGVISSNEDRIADHQRSAIMEHFDAWVVSRQAKGVTDTYLKDSRRYLDRLSLECRFKVLGEMNREALEKWLAAQTAAGMSARTRNTYRTTLFTFCNWCVETGRLLKNPFEGVHRADENADRRRQRRAMTEDELRRLLFVARYRPLAEYGRETIHKDAADIKSKRATWMAKPLSYQNIQDAAERARDRLAKNPDLITKLELRGRERALVYKTLVTTGLRKSELASVKLQHLDLDAEQAFLTLDAKSEKNRQGNCIPLRGDLAADLRDWLADRLSARPLVADDAPTIKFDRKAGRDSKNAADGALRLSPDESLFEVPDKLVKILDRDLEAAGIPKRDDRGRTLDVHALRTTFGTHLSKAGVPLRTAQAAMRHSDPKLTANSYTDPRLLDVHGAIEALPSLPLNDTRKNDSETMRATGTASQLVPLLVPASDKMGQTETFAGKVTAHLSEQDETVASCKTPLIKRKNASKEAISFEASQVGATRRRLNFFWGHFLVGSRSTGTWRQLATCEFTVPCNSPRGLK